jgi:hypothetical protein
MESTDFPQYRRSSNGLNWYRIASPVELVEVQRVGKRWLLHRLRAEAYPEKARILDLLAMTDGHVACCPAAEVEEKIAAAG